ncbi:MAG: hypothetical protein MZV63_36010 [Marinilabiliales bacterium]|nr:hypothetical protein [Marinilabiliales bacterium]
MQRSRPKEFRESPYKVNLFAEGLLRKGETLSVVFPRKTNYVLGSMGLMLGGSGLFLADNYIDFRPQPVVHSQAEEDLRDAG